MKEKINLKREAKKLVADNFTFLQNDELQTIFYLLILLGFFRFINYLSQAGFEKIIIALITSGFLADGLNKLTNKGGGTND